jgi:hypothetical protein
VHEVPELEPLAGDSAAGQPANEPVRSRAAGQSVVGQDVGWKVSNIASTGATFPVRYTRVCTRTVWYDVMSSVYGARMGVLVVVAAV